MARKKLNLKEELLKRKTFSIPEIQKELSVGYKELRNCVSEMEKTGHATLADDGLNYIVDTQPAPKKSNSDDRSSSKQHSQTAKSFDLFDLEDEDDDDEEDYYDDMIARRRRELMERLARMSKMDEDEDDDDAEDEEEKDSDTIKTVEDKLGENYVEQINEANNCKLIDCVDYGDSKTNAKKIADKLAVFGFRSSLKAVQYGTGCIRYVFDYLSRQNINGVKHFVSYIADIIKTESDKVRVIAPWGDNMFCVVVEHNAVFDPLSKKVLKYWIMHNGGCASIASVQRGLGIGFNRAGKIMDHLLEFGCVGQPSDDYIIKELHVKLNLQEIDILFPKSLGWD